MPANIFEPAKIKLQNGNGSRTADSKQWYESAFDVRVIVDFVRGKLGSL